MKLTHRPIGNDWPGQFTRDAAREPSRFTSPWSSTRDLLAREVTAISRSVNPEVILQVAVDESGVRVDGGIRANARPSHPGVIVSFESRHGPLRYACDRFSESTHWPGRLIVPGWQANVRAVALGLEALRKIDRYGIATDGQQYQGWQALPPGTPMPAAAMTVEEAARFIAEHAGQDFDRWVSIVKDPWVGLSVYRDAAKLHHPDAGGDPAVFRQLVEARGVLEANR